jgi:hypothetical protein
MFFLGTCAAEGGNTTKGYLNRHILVGGLEHGWIMTFHSVGNVIIPSDEVMLIPCPYGGLKKSPQVAWSELIYDPHLQKTIGPINELL